MQSWRVDFVLAADGAETDARDADAGTHTDLSFGNPGWEDLCWAFGWRHIAVDAYADLAPALASGRDHAGPVLVTLKVDYSHGLAPPHAAA